MRYRVDVARVADRALAKIEASARKRILERIAALGDDPQPAGSKKLTGEVDAYRLRVGDYRVLYRIEEKVLLILVVKIGHRREVYRGL